MPHWVCIVQIEGSKQTQGVEQPPPVAASPETIQTIQLFQQVDTDCIVIAF